MEEFIIMLCFISAGVLTWTNTGNVLLTILAVILGGFVGSLIAFQIHETKRMKMFGLSSRQELREFDREANEIRTMIESGIEARRAELDAEAQEEGYTSYAEKMNLEVIERLQNSEQYYR